MGMEKCYPSQNTDNGIILQFYYHHHILAVSPYPLFRYGGEVNDDVLASLLYILDDPRLNPLMREKKEQWPSGLSFEYSPFIAVTAEDFSSFVAGEAQSMNDSGAIVIKLFETVYNQEGVEHGHLTELTSQWWQLVYRSVDECHDVLTLWMVEPYRMSHFNGTRYDFSIRRADERHVDLDIGNPWTSIIADNANTIRSDERIASRLPACDNFFLEGNYSTSIARANLLRDQEHLLALFDIERYLVAPQNIPGNWQSSIFQTDRNARGVFYVSGQFYDEWSNGLGSENSSDGLGAAGLIWNHSRSQFALVNGKDGLSIGPYSGHWPHTRIVPTYNDLLWLPSDFETRTMGFGKDNARFQSFIRYPGRRDSELRFNYRESPEIDGRTDYAFGRSGLWRLNGFDRGFDADKIAIANNIPRSWDTDLVWLRSADNMGLGNVNTGSNAGNRYGYGVTRQAGLRPALHLSITMLRQMPK